MREKDVKQRILEACIRLWQRNMLAAADGNVSYKISPDRIIITPSGKAKAFIEKEDLAVMNLQGEVIQGKPSAEKSMHLKVYQTCPEAKAVVHAHPPHAIAWSVARPELRELPAESLSEVILACGRIPMVPYATPTTEGMADHLAPFLPDHRVMILQRHGGLSWGESLDEAVNGMERLEHSAQILWLAETLGGLTQLPKEEVSLLKDMRLQMGNKTL